MIEIYVSGYKLNKKLPILEALDHLTDDFIDNGNMCPQTAIDLRDALRYFLTPDQYIKELIAEKNLTQSDLAKMLGCSQANVSMLLSGKRFLTARMKEKLTRCLTNDESDKSKSR